MKFKFNPSVNIVRDLNEDFNYIRTENSERVLDRINSNIENGFRCFYIVGSYGTGKSSFLLALEKQLSEGIRYFKGNISLNKVKKFKFINLIGEYKSFQQILCSKLKIKNDFKRDFDKYYEGFKKQNKGLIILVDEFGKFLEYAAKYNPESELYFIQILAEYINDPKKDIIFISAVHQSFDSYKFELDQKQKREWEKIKGRLKEILFNEPTEQLLYLASKYIGKKNTQPPLHIHKLLKVFKESSLISSNFKIDIDIASNLYPLDLLTVTLLTQTLQDFGQNERSLFTFLQSNEEYGLTKYDKQNNPYYNINCLYDYLINDFYSVIYSKYNKDYIKWMNIRNSLERAESIFNGESSNYLKLIKAIGLLNIYSQKGATIDEEFLIIYGKYALGILNPKKLLDDLKKKKILRYLDYKKTFILFEGTDLDLDLELNKANNVVSLPDDITYLINEYIDLPYVQANSVSIKKGTPRFFEFRINEIPIQNSKINETDGIINLILRRNIKSEDVVESSKEINDSILFVIYKNIETIEKSLLQIEKTKYLMKEFSEDSVALKELANIKDYFINELNILLVDDLFNCNDNITWIYHGEIKKVRNRRDLNELLSFICDDVYFAAPAFNNELINRNKLPAPISSARRNLLINLLKYWNQEDVGFQKDKFPPEKTIYLSLIKKTGIHRKDGNSFLLGNPSSEPTFDALWTASEGFLESAKNGKKNLISIFEILRKKPFKLKQGFLDFWISIFLIIKKDDFALFDDDGYIPNLSSDFFDLFLKKPNNYYIKTFDVKGIKLDIFNKYREIINQSSENKFSNTNFIETIKPFLVFYKNLSEYAKTTKQLSKQAIQIREAIANSKEPEKTFFEDFPRALGFNILNLKDSKETLESYVFQLQKSIKEIRECYSNLVDRVENHLKKVIGADDSPFPDYKLVLSKRLGAINFHLITQQQKIILSRINSEYNERIGWINSFVSSIIEKPLDVISDEDEKVLYGKIEDTINEFDNIIDIVKFDSKVNKADIVKFELTTLNRGTRKLIVTIPQNGEFKDIENNIRKFFTNDTTKNQKVLIKLLNDLFENE